MPGGFEGFLHAMAPYSAVIWLSFADPVVIAIGLWMGWHADQAGKLVLAGLAAGLAATALSFLLSLIGVGWLDGGYFFGPAHALVRVLAGCCWAALGYGARALAAARR